MAAFEGRELPRVSHGAARSSSAVLDLADRLKRKISAGATSTNRSSPAAVPPAARQAVAARTRLSLELAVEQLGGDAVHLNCSEVGLGHRESIREEVDVLSRYFDAIVIERSPRTRCTRPPRMCTSPSSTG